MIKTIAPWTCAALVVVSACGPNHDYTMCDALAVGEFGIAGSAIEMGADVDRFFGPGNGPMSGYTCLMASARTGSVESVRFLLDHGADPNVGAPNGGTPLMLAAGRGHIDVVRLLLDHDADPARTTTAGETALALARAGGHAEIVALLSAGEGDPPADHVPVPAS